MRKSRRCLKDWTHNWWVFLMTTIAITVSKKDTEHGHVHLGRRIRCKLLVRFVDNHPIQLQIVHKSKHISRNSKQTKLRCCLKRNMISSVNNCNKNPREVWCLSQTSTERNCWLSVRTHQEVSNKPNLHTPTNKRQRKQHNKTLQQTTCLNSRTIDPFICKYIFIYLIW